MTNDIAVKSHVKYSRWGFAACAWIFALLVAVQVFIAGLATFVDSAHWNTHTLFVRILEVFPLLMFILSFFGKVPAALRWLSLALILLIVLQYVTANMSSVPEVGALHPVIAMIMFWLAVFTASRAPIRSSN
ncbi:MAG TPA: DUF6220 domain-containing protein [Paenibacillaceae bacterium]